MATTNSSSDRSIVQRVYNRFVRPHTPRKLAHCNGVITRRQRLLDAHDHFPDYEAGFVDAVRDTVTEDDDVVVVGGGFGVSSVTAARQGADVTVYEANSDQAEIVREAARLNHVQDRVSVIQCVVGEAVSTYGPADDSPRLSGGQLPAGDVLAMDCEGAELQILEEVQHCPATVIVESHGFLGSPPGDVRASLDRLGYVVRDEVVEDQDDGISIFVADRGR